MKSVLGKPAAPMAVSLPRQIAWRQGGRRLPEPVLRILSVWIERARQRRCLAGLPDRSLKDIGISRCDALQEARKPFWRG